jgi:hypothetical protein
MLGIGRAVRPGSPASRLDVSIYASAHWARDVVGCRSIDDPFDDRSPEWPQREREREREIEIERGDRRLMRVVRR